MRILIFIFTLLSCTLLAQNKSSDIQVACTGIKSQGQTGTCWSFSTVSFIESEIIRRMQTEIDLSEMYIVRNIYKEKATNYFFRQGKANFSQGALAHDMLNAADKYGLVPEEVYSGLVNTESHSHEQLFPALEKVVKTALEEKTPYDSWMSEFEEVLDEYLGKVPETFTFQGKTFTPQSFKEYLAFEADDYMHITSFTHHPYYVDFILEIPDNFSNGSFFNVPINELHDLGEYTLKMNRTFAWDGDVSEAGFDAKEGYARFLKRIMVNQVTRQASFNSFETTDDHLMHIVGKKEEDGISYFVVKNSWGEVGPFDGYLYMDSNYYKMKTVAITIPKEIYYSYWKDRAEKE